MSAVPVGSGFALPAHGTSFRQEKATMKTRTTVIPPWVEEERMFLRYLMSPHDGHAYPEDVLDGICLIFSWVLVGVSVACVLVVIADAIIR
jgi:hypothetical protein